MFNVDVAEPFLMMALPRIKSVSVRERRRLERDKWVRRSVVALAMEDFETAINTNEIALGEEEESFLIRFFQFILEHQEEILAFIQMIMALFADGDED
jgi:hypothetical protein